MQDVHKTEAYNKESSSPPREYAIAAGEEEEFKVVVMAFSYYKFVHAIIII